MIAPSLNNLYCFFGFQIRDSLRCFFKQTVGAYYPRSKRTTSGNLFARDTSNTSLPPSNRSFCRRFQVSRLRFFASFIIALKVGIRLVRYSSSDIAANSSTTSSGTSSGMRITSAIILISALRRRNRIVLKRWLSVIFRTGIGTPFLVTHVFFVGFLRAWSPLTLVYLP